MSNIAEGFGRYSRSELRHYARGSVTEVRSHLYMSRELGYLDEASHRELHDLCMEGARMVAAFRASIDRT